MNLEEIMKGREKLTVGTAAELLGSARRIYAAVIGLKGKPEIRRADFAFEENGGLYFAAAKNTRFYAELSMKPAVSLSAEAAEKNVVLRLGAKAVFAEDGALIETCLARNAELGAKYRDCPEMLIAFFLTDISAELYESGADFPAVSVRLPDPAGTVTGVVIRKKTELRDRLAKILIRREEEGPAEDHATAGLYDGALFLFAETAKKLWPRMDITPIERAAVFETYDERERYTALARSLIGNAVIDKPEDLTYWLNPETLSALYAQSGE